MDKRDPKTIALLFNDAINNRDIGGLAHLMGDGYTFIDSEDHIERGKQKGIDSWSRFFRLFPDYKNHFNRVLSRGGLVIMVGHSTCSDKRLAGPAIWTARISDQKVAEWRVYEDTPENRKGLGLIDT